MVQEVSGVFLTPKRKSIEGAEILLGLRFHEANNLRQMHSIGNFSLNIFNFAIVIAKNKF